jgi:hypothetical protein
LCRGAKALEGHGIANGHLETLRLKVHIFVWHPHEGSYKFGSAPERTALRFGCRWGCGFQGIAENFFNGGEVTGGHAVADEGFKLGLVDFDSHGEGLPPLVGVSAGPDRVSNFSQLDLRRELAGWFSGKKWWRWEPSKRPVGRQQRLKAAARVAGTEVIAAELFAQFLIAMHDA